MSHPSGGDGRATGRDQVHLAMAACGRNSKRPLTYVRGSVNSVRYRAARVSERLLPVLGGPQALGRRLGSLAALSHAVTQGLPKAALRETAQRIFSNPAEQKQLMRRIVPEATFKRRRDKLSAAESERTERLARVIAAAEYSWDDAEYSWDDREAARRFLTAPHPALGGKTPIDAAMTELSARQEEEILGKIFHGLPA